MDEPLTWLVRPHWADAGRGHVVHADGKSQTGQRVTARAGRGHAESPEPVRARAPSMSRTTMPVTAALSLGYDVFTALTLFVWTTACGDNAPRVLLTCVAASHKVVSDIGVFLGR